MTGRQRQRYPLNWEELAKACKVRDNWTCQHCGVKQLEQRMSRRGNPYFVYLHAAHMHHDQANEQPELVALCISCHGRYDYEYKIRERRIELERLKHRIELARRVDLRFYGG